MTRYLSLKEILWIHYRLIEDFGGSHGVGEEKSLLSVVEAPQQAVFGQEQYPTVFEKAAVYLRNIIGDHPLLDGNKRTAVTVCGIFLMRNNRKLSVNPRLLEDFAVEIATKHLRVPQIANWLKKHSQK